MNTGIFETEHFEGIFPVIQLFDDNSHDLTIFVYAQSYRQLQHLFGDRMNKYHWIVKAEQTSKRHFLFTMYREIRKRKLQLVYLNTVSDNFIFYALLIRFCPGVRFIVTLHNINSYLEYRPALSARRMIRNAGRKMLVRVVHEFNVVSLSMVGYLRAKLSGNQAVYCIPGAVFNESDAQQTQPANMAPLHIVVTGSIDGKRRDYAQVFALLRLLAEKNLRVTLVLLGGFYGAYGQEVLAAARQWKHDSVHLAYYDNATVDQPEFDRVMNASHLVFLPSVIQTVISDGVTEIYGQSMCSGNLFDIIKHAKPFIIPNALQVDSFLEQSCFRYQDIADAAAFCASLVKNEKKYTEWLTQALYASRNYTVEKVRDRNPDVFKAVVRQIA